MFGIEGLVGPKGDTKSRQNDDDLKGDQKFDENSKKPLTKTAQKFLSTRAINSS